MVLQIAELKIYVWILPNSEFVQNLVIEQLE